MQLNDVLTDWFVRRFGHALCGKLLSSSCGLMSRIHTFIYDMQQWILLGVSLFSLSCVAQSDWAERAASSPTHWICQLHQQHYPERWNNTACAYAYGLERAGDLAEQRLYGLGESVRDDFDKVPCTGWFGLHLLGGLYFPLFESALEAARLPVEFRSLPVVLSGLQEGAAYAPGRAGLWQLSFPVAVKYGLRVDNTVDERMDPEAATAAACSYLADLARRYEGDRTKALLAFVRSVPYVNALPEDVSPTNLPEADRHWFALWTALRGWNPVQPGDPVLPEVLDALGSMGEMRLREPVSVDVLTDVLHTDAQTLRAMNASFIGQKIPGGEGAPVLIAPNAWVNRLRNLGDSLYTYEALLAQRKAAALAAKRAEEERRRREEGVTYRVRSGDVLGLIAERHGVRVSEIKQWNGLRSDRINVGQKLLIYPRGTKSAPDASETSKPEPPAANRSSDTAASSSSTTYTVRSGDSLWLIARKFPGVSAEDIMKANGIDTDIQPGQVLNIPRR